MTRTKKPQSMYDELVAAIVKAVPAKQRTYLGSYWPDEETTEYTLEDVLRFAMAFKVHGFAVDRVGFFLVNNRITRHQWHLGHDLSWHRENAPETIAFLHSLRCR